MRIAHTVTLGADRDTVWDFVSDTGAILALLPGVMSVEPAGPDSWRVRLRQKVAFIEADFDVQVSIVRRTPPTLIEFRSEGKGVQVPALVVTKDELRLSSDGATTDLAYTSEIQLSGRLAALGHAVMKVKARQMIDEFQRRIVTRFEEVMAKADREGA